MYASIRRGIRHRIGLQPEVDARRPGGAGHAGRCGTPATYRSSAGLTRADCPICLSAAVEASTDRRAVSTRVSQKFEHLLGLADAADHGAGDGTAVAEQGRHAEREASARLGRETVAVRPGRWA